VRRLTVQGEGWITAEVRSGCVFGVIPVSPHQLTSHEVTCLNVIEIAQVYVSGVQNLYAVCEPTFSGKFRCSKLFGVKRV